MFLRILLLQTPTNAFAILVPGYFSFVIGFTNSTFVLNQLQKKRSFFKNVLQFSDVLILKDGWYSLCSTCQNCMEYCTYKSLIYFHVYLLMYLLNVRPLLNTI